MTALPTAVSFADSLMKRYPDAEQFPYKAWCYTHGFYLWGIIKLYEQQPDPGYLNYLTAYADSHLEPDFSIRGFNYGTLDDHMDVSVLCWLYHETGNEAYRKACEKVYAQLADYPRNPNGSYWHSRTMNGQVWVDGLFMIGMFLLKYGMYIGSREDCFAENIRQLTLAFETHQKDKTGLLYHGYCYQSRAPWASRITGCSPEIWSEGLGWYAMILAETMHDIPADFPGMDRIRHQHALLADNLTRVQRCGLWFQVVDKPQTPGNFEDTSGTAMFLYMLGSGVRDGLLTEDPFRNAVERGRLALLSKLTVDPAGGIHVLDACDGLGVQRSYDDYIHFPKTIDAKEATAAVLWALDVL